jgi:NAD(P)H-dependent FMN reductase
VSDHETHPRLLALAGSLRAGSFNRLALRYAVAGAREAGALVDEPGPEIAASFGVSAGRQGTARSQQSLRLTLSAVNVWVLPRTVLIPSARAAFDEACELKDERQVQDLVALGRALAVAARAGGGRR